VMECCATWVSSITPRLIYSSTPFGVASSPNSLRSRNTPPIIPPDLEHITRPSFGPENGSYFWMPMNSRS